MPPDPTPKPSPPRSLLPALVRRHPILLRRRRRGTPRNPNCGEVAGGTAANCAAILCCLPCGIVNLFVLATVRLPAGLCRKAIRERRDSEKEREEKGDGGGKLGSDDEFVFVGFKAKSGAAVVWPAVSPSPEMSKLEDEMWAKFGETGFWRSPSFKEN